MTTILALNNQNNNFILILQKTFICTSLFEYYVDTEKKVS